MKINLKQFIFLLLISLLSISAGDISCPKYSCVDTKDNSCASVKSMIKDNKGFNLVSLTDKCKKGEYCNMNFPPWIYLTEDKKDESFYCEQTPSLTITRFPGEQCSTNAECIKSGPLTGECNNGKCSGGNDHADCFSHADCLAGLYCENKKCTPQKPFKSECTESAQCENKYLCHKGICQITPYSLDSGEGIDLMDPFNGFMCKFGFTHKGKCGYLVEEELGEDSFIKCNHGDRCKYTIHGTKDTIENACSCGYNSEGQGYCEQGHNKSIIKIKIRCEGMA
jgi:hypothetical protein